MFTKAEYSLFTPQFRIIRTVENYIEFQSLSTKHCWIIQKHSYSENRPIIIYHKHTQNTPYYHKHWQCRSVKQAIKSISDHDTYVLNTKRSASK